MKDPANREMMAKLYRLVEKYETPQTISAEKACPYFSGLVDDCEALWGEYSGNAFAEEFIAALCIAVERRFLAANKAQSGEEVSA